MDQYHPTPLPPIISLYPPYSNIQLPTQLDCSKLPPNLPTYLVSKTHPFIAIIPSTNQLIIMQRIEALINAVYDILPETFTIKQNVRTLNTFTNINP